MPAVTLRSSFARAARAPTFLELFGDRGSVVGNPNLLPERDGRMHPYHKTVFDWLTKEGREQEEFFVDRGEVEAWLGRRCAEISRACAHPVI